MKKKHCNQLENNAFISKSNLNQNQIKQNELLNFDNTFIEKKNIIYNNGVFTFLEKGTYLINFNIYIEKTKLISINLNVEYTINNNKYNFIISQKGIDKIGTSTFHSLVLPCSFIEKFYKHDTLQIRNISNGTVDLISNYVPEATNALLSICKIK